MTGTRRFEIKKPPGARKLLVRLRRLRGRMPADFKFDRLEANHRCALSAAPLESKPVHE